MQRAIKNFIKKESEKINSKKGENHINQNFDFIELEIDRVKRTEINRAKKKKLRKWRKEEKLNCGHDNKKLGRSKR
ncbi:hypothetical protein ES704_01007 [subsurface metagenome]|jgi:diketogulonate reductase-like aldo/keto reductase